MSASASSVPFPPTLPSPPSSVTVVTGLVSPKQLRYVATAVVEWDASSYTPTISPCPFWPSVSNESMPYAAPNWSNV